MPANLSGLILTAATTTTRGNRQELWGAKHTFQAYGTTSSGAGAATIIVEVSNHPSPATATDVGWKTAGTFTLTLGTTEVNDVFVLDAPYRFCRAQVTAISGTGASVNVAAGSEAS
jgi:hypothetical protein